MKQTLIILAYFVLACSFIHSDEVRPVPNWFNLKKFSVIKPVIKRTFESNGTIYRQVGEMVTYDTTIVSWNATITRHIDAAINLPAQSIWFFPGRDEVGTNVNLLDNNGPHYHIKDQETWDGTQDVDGTMFYPFIISLQPPTEFPVETAIKTRIDAMLNHPDFDIASVHLTGYSHGGWMADTYITNDNMGGPYTYAGQISSVVTVMGQSSSGNISPYPDKFENFSLAGGYYWSIEQQGDGRGGGARVGAVNDGVPGRGWFTQTTYGANTHTCCQNTIYDPLTTDYTLGNVDIFSAADGELSVNIYEFMLSKGDLSATGAPAEEGTYFDAGEMPCRVGAGEKFNLGNSIITGVTTTAIFVPYINRDLIFGQEVQGGDTIVIWRNPNNGGIWTDIEIGDFGGSRGCPVIVMSDSITTVRDPGAAFKVAARDSNFVAWAVFDGLANRLTKDVVYGFRVDNGHTATDDENAIGFNALLMHHSTLNGFAAINVGVGVFVKVNSDSTYPWKIFDNFRQRGNTYHDIILHRINGEAMYLGHTDIAGTAQVGNDGPTVVSDSTTIYRVIVDSVEWDGIQLSNAREGNEIHDVMTYRTGVANQSSQQFSIFIGGYSTGSIYNSVVVNGTGPMGFLGIGKNYAYNNILDSIDNGGADADNLYVSQATVAGVPTPSPLQIFVYDNIFSRINRDAVFHADNNNLALKGAIRDNLLVDPTRDETTLIDTNAEDTLENNTTVTTIDLDASALGTLKAWLVYKLVEANPGHLYSFFDVDRVPVFVKPAGYRWKFFIR